MAFNIPLLPTIPNDLTIINTLTVGGNTTLGGNLTVAGDLDVTGALDFTGDVEITGDLDVTGLLTLDPAGAYGAGTGLAFGGGSYIRESAAGVLDYSATTHAFTGNQTVSGKVTAATGNTSGMWFGDGDSGIYESSANAIRFDLGGANLIQLTAGSLRQTTSARFNILLSAGASETTPTYCWYDDTDTGLGKYGADALSLIAGGVEAMRLTEDTGLIAISAPGTMTVTGVPTAATLAGASLSVNPATAPANGWLIGAGVGGTPVFSVDEDGDVVAVTGSFSQGTSGASRNSLSGLDIQHSNSVALTFRTPADKIAYILFGDPGSSTIGQIRYDHTSDTMVLKATSDTLYLKAGNVGIGNPAPTYTLDVTGDFRATTNATIGGTLAVGGDMTLTQAATSTFKIDSDSTAYFELEHGAANGGYFRFRSAGVAKAQLSHASNNNLSLRSLVASTLDLGTNDTASFIISAANLATFTGVPTAASLAGASLSINPATATAGYYLQSWGVGGTAVSSIDAQGRVIFGGSSITTTTKAEITTGPSVSPPYTTILSVNGYVTGADATGLLVAPKLAQGTIKPYFSGMTIQPSILNYAAGNEVTNYYGIYVPVPLSTGVVTTGYGIHVTAPTQGEANYAAYFGGNTTTTGNATIGGTITTSAGVLTNTTVVDDTYTILVTDFDVICNKGTGFTVTLPAGVVGQIFRIKNVGAGAVTLDGDAAETIDGQATQTLNQWDSITIKCYSAGLWAIL